MSQRNLAGGHTLPPNPVYLDFEKTDGDPKQLPTNTTEVVDADGQVNYMKPVGLDDSSNVHWRCQVAVKVAERLGRPRMYFFLHCICKYSCGTILICHFSWQ